jgi:hypothetical protein
VTPITRYRKGSITKCRAPKTTGRTSPREISNILILIQFLVVTCSIEFPIEVDKNIQIPMVEPKMPKGKHIFILETVSQYPSPSNQLAISSPLQITESTNEKKLYTQIHPRRIIPDHDVCLCFQLNHAGSTHNTTPKKENTLKW